VPLHARRATDTKCILAARQKKAAREQHTEPEVCLGTTASRALCTAVQQPAARSPTQAVPVLVCYPVRGEPTIHPLRHRMARVTARQHVCSLAGQYDVCSCRTVRVSSSGTTLEKNYSSLTNSAARISSSIIGCSCPRDTDTTRATEIHTTTTQSQITDTVPAYPS
jgi:hypothetical protein